jgi:hypothetical protein
MRDTAQRNSFTRQTIAQASCAICDILATNVGIVRKSGVPEAGSRQYDGGRHSVDICYATVRWWEAALHDPFIVTFDFGWGPPGSEAYPIVKTKKSEN